MRWGELESDLRSAWIRKHTCLCVSSQWGVGLVKLVPGFEEAQGTVSHRAEVHTELMIISFLNPLCLSKCISSSHTNMQMYYSKLIGCGNRRIECMWKYIVKTFHKLVTSSPVVILAVCFSSSCLPWSLAWCRFYRNKTLTSLHRSLMFYNPVPSSSLPPPRPLISRTLLSVLLYDLHLASPSSEDSISMSQGSKLPCSLSLHTNTHTCTHAKTAKTQSLSLFFTIDTTTEFPCCFVFQDYVFM